MLLIARGATSACMDPQQQLLGTGHGAIGEPFPCPSLAPAHARPVFPGACGS